LKRKWLHEDAVATEKERDGRSRPEIAAAPRKEAKENYLFACILVLICALSFGLRACLSAKPGMSAAPAYIITKAEKGISPFRSAAAHLKPADSYEVTSWCVGEILSDGFEEGDVVEKGAVLYIRLIRTTRRPTSGAPS
jgi:HlyD family secretion protein